MATDPEQVLVTSGAIAAIAATAQALVGAGDRALVESPVYPNAVSALRRAGARVVTAPVDPDGWDLDAFAAVVRQAHPKVAYLIPDYQNPTGVLMGDEQRGRLAGVLAATRTTAIIDESHAGLALDGEPQPLPFPAHSPSRSPSAVRRRRSGVGCGWAGCGCPQPWSDASPRPGWASTWAP